MELYEWIVVIFREGRRVVLGAPMPSGVYLSRSRVLSWKYEKFFFRFGKGATFTRPYIRCIPHLCGVGNDKLNVAGSGRDDFAIRILMT